jgi:hypothetical protein
MELVLDTMVVMRRAPTQSWGNPVERVMSVLSLGLQRVALAREVMAKENFEDTFKKCKGMSAVRKAADAYEKEVVVESIAEEANVVCEQQQEEEQEIMLQQLQ